MAARTLVSKLTFGTGGAVLGGILVLSTLSLADHEGTTGPPTRTIPYEGYVDFEGQPVSGNLKMNFALFGCADPDGDPGCPLPLWVAYPGDGWDGEAAAWTDGWPTYDEETPRVPVYSGRFTAELGGADMAPFDEHFFLDNDELYLGLWVEDHALSALQRINAAPMALRTFEAGNFRVQGLLDVVGNTSLHGDLAVDGSTTVSNITASGPVIANSTTTLNGDLSVPGSSTVALGGNLTVNGSTTLTGATINGHVSMPGSRDLTVGRNASIGGTLTVTGASTFGGATFNANITMGSNDDITLTGNNATLTLTNNADLIVEPGSRLNLPEIALGAYSANQTSGDGADAYSYEGCTEGRKGDIGWAMTGGQISICVCGDNDDGIQIAWRWVCLNY